ncbi:hypothetical protein HBF25_13265 [Luteibacter anthropi]|uniref:Uncharacterized protein n=1 Tax=Luteibacter anthropi TaxID=564369 RepID=A0A7X5ZIW9_9GAMM|nr:hypothetical protein [Luteibacter anthropi]
MILLTMSAEGTVGTMLLADRLTVTLAASVIVVVANRLMDGVLRFKRAEG